MNNHIRELMHASGFAAPDLAGRAQVLVDLVIRDVVRICSKSSHRDDDMGAILARQIEREYGMEGVYDSAKNTNQQRAALEK